MSGWYTSRYLFVSAARQHADHGAVRTFNSGEKLILSSKRHLAPHSFDPKGISSRHRSVDEIFHRCVVGQHDIDIARSTELLVDLLDGFRVRSTLPVSKS